MTPEQAAEKLLTRCSPKEAIRIASDRARETFFLQPEVSGIWREVVKILENRYDR